jgi:hypothetical protein
MPNVTELLTISAGSIENLTLLQGNSLSLQSFIVSLQTINSKLLQLQQASEKIKKILLGYRETVRTQWFQETGIEKINFMQPKLEEILKLIEVGNLNQVKIKVDNLNGEMLTKFGEKQYNESTNSFKAVQEVALAINELNDENLEQIHQQINCLNNMGVCTTALNELRKNINLEKLTCTAEEQAQEEQAQIDVKYYKQLADQVVVTTDFNRMAQQLGIVLQVDLNQSEQLLAKITQPVPEQPLTLASYPQLANIPTHSTWQMISLAGQNIMVKGPVAPDRMRMILNLIRDEFLRVATSSQTVPINIPKHLQKILKHGESLWNSIDQKLTRLEGAQSTSALVTPQSQLQQEFSQFIYFYSYFKILINPNLSDAQKMHLIFSTARVGTNPLLPHLETNPSLVQQSLNKNNFAISSIVTGWLKDDLEHLVPQSKIEPDLLARMFANHSLVHTFIITGQRLTAEQMLLFSKTDVNKPTSARESSQVNDLQSTHKITMNQQLIVEAVNSVSMTDASTSKKEQKNQLQKQTEDTLNRCEQLKTEIQQLDLQSIELSAKIKQFHQRPDSLKIQQAISAGIQPPNVVNSQQKQLNRLEKKSKELKEQIDALNFGQRFAKNTKLSSLSNNLKTVLGKIIVLKTEEIQQKEANLRLKEKALEKLVSTVETKTQNVSSFLEEPSLSTKEAQFPLAETTNSAQGFQPSQNQVLALQVYNDSENLDVDEMLKNLKVIESNIKLFFRMNPNLFQNNEQIHDIYKMGLQLIETLTQLQDASSSLALSRPIDSKKLRDKYLFLASFHQQISMLTRQTKQERERDIGIDDLNMSSQAQIKPLNQLVQQNRSPDLQLSWPRGPISNLTSLWSSAPVFRLFHTPNLSPESIRKILCNLEQQQSSSSVTPHNQFLSTTHQAPILQKSTKDQAIQTIPEDSQGLLALQQENQRLFAKLELANQQLITSETTRQQIESEIQNLQAFRDIPDQAAITSEIATLTEENLFLKQELSGLFAKFSKEYDGHFQEFTTQRASADELFQIKEQLMSKVSQLPQSRPSEKQFYEHIQAQDSAYNQINDSINQLLAERETIVTRCKEAFDHRNYLDGYQFHIQNLSILNQLVALELERQQNLTAQIQLIEQTYPAAIGTDPKIAGPSSVNSASSSLPISSNGNHSQTTAEHLFSASSSGPSMASTHQSKHSLFPQASSVGSTSAVPVEDHDWQLYAVLEKPETLPTLQNFERVEPFNINTQTDTKFASPEGKTVFVPTTGHPYQFHYAKGEAPRATLLEKHAGDPRDVNYKHNLALDVINMMDNILSKGPTLYLDTKESYIAEIAEHYVKYLSEKGLDVDAHITHNGRKLSSFSTESESIAKRIVKYPFIANVQNSAWFQEAQAVLRLPKVRLT